MPCSMDLRAALSAAICAANGVDFFDPLKPMLPELAHATEPPCVSVIVTIVLLKLDRMCATPCETFLMTRFLRVRSFFGAAGIYLFTSRSFGFLLACDGLLRTFARAGVRLRALPANGQAATMAQAAVAADVHQPLDRTADLAPEVAFDFEILFDLLAKLLDVFVFEVFDADIRIDAGDAQQPYGSGPADAEDIRQSDLDAFFTRQVDARDSCHSPILAPACA